MAGPISGPGIGLSLPQSLYPANLYNGVLQPPGNHITLAPGQGLPIPRGNYWVDIGAYAVMQYLDPVTTAWRSFTSSRPGPQLVTGSDGFNFRAFNPTGTAAGSIVTNGGSGYAQGSTTVTPSAGNSTWQPVVGGRLNTTISITAAGGGYTIPPIVMIPPPPPPGYGATAIAVLSSGTVSSITVVNQGAGYGTTAPAIAIYPNPTDPAFLSGGITSNATATATVVGAGQLSAVICTNPGSSFATVPSLTIAGAGTSAAATIVPIFTLASASITSGGVAYTTAAAITTVGGVPSATPAYTNPAYELTGYIPRQAQIGIAAAGGGTITTIGTIIDGGMFAGTPTAVVFGGAPTTPATIALVVGSTNATVTLTPAG